MVDLVFKKLRQVARTQPLPATTWVTTDMLRTTANTKEGVSAQHWVCEEIINAAPPREVWPLLHDGKMIADAAFDAPAAAERRAQHQDGEGEEEAGRRERVASESASEDEEMECITDSECESKEEMDQTSIPFE